MYVSVFLFFLVAALPYLRGQDQSPRPDVKGTILSFRKTCIKTGVNWDEKVKQFIVSEVWREREIIELTEEEKNLIVETLQDIETQEKKATNPWNQKTFSERLRLTILPYLLALLGNSKGGIATSRPVALSEQVLNKYLVYLLDVFGDANGELTTMEKEDF